MNADVEVLVQLDYNFERYDNCFTCDQDNLKESWIGKIICLVCPTSPAKQTHAFRPSYAAFRTLQYETVIINLISRRFSDSRLSTFAHGLSVFIAISQLFK